MNRLPGDVVYCCGARTDITDSRALQGTIRRRRRCLRCKQTWSTVEILWTDPVSQTRRIDEAANALLGAWTALAILKESFLRPEKTNGPAGEVPPGRQ